MKLKIFLGVAACALFASSCSDEMDYREDTGGKYDEAYVKQAFDNVRGMVTNIYGQLEYEQGQNYGGAFLGSASDESVFSKTSSIETFFNGNWSPSNPQNTEWTSCFEAISDANIYLADFANGLNFPEHELDDSYKQEMNMYVKYFPYEVRFLRAYYYFKLVRQYGDVPFYTEKLSKDSVNSLKRTPAKEIFKFIDDECADIVNHLPMQWAQAAEAITTDQLRATKLAVLALRARAALYAASPLFNKGGNEQELWRQAALKSKAVIDSCLSQNFALEAKYENTWGDGSQVTGPTHEIIFSRPTWMDTKPEQRNFPVGITGAGAGGNCPTQTLVEAYDLKDGTEVDWSDPAKAVAKFGDFDPRFSKTIAHNGEKKWPFYNTKALETYYNGESGEPKIGATPTSYYLKKLLDHSGVVDLRPNKSTKIRHPWAIFRLGEFYLDYAEAVFRWLGSADLLPSGDGFEGGYAKSAREAVNETRARAGVAGLPAGLDNDTFWHKYERERMVELAFEGHRFWDVRRWKEGYKFSGKNIYVMKITKNDDGTFSYSRQNLADERVDWDDKMYLFPIDATEMLKHQKYGVEWTQNPGWN